MKNEVVLRLLTFILAVLLPAAALSGCGGGSAQPTPEAQLVDSFLRGIVDGDPAAVLNALPPERLAELRADMPQATEEELGQVFLDALRFEFPYTSIRELSFRTERRDDSSADVYYWGVFDQTDASGATHEVTVREGEVQPFNVVTVDGACYLNV
jgi:hypothetical protein